MSTSAVLIFLLTVLRVSAQSVSYMFVRLLLSLLTLALSVYILNTLDAVMKLIFATAHTSTHMKILTFRI